MKVDLRRFRLMKEIMRELYKAVEKLGGDAGLLAAIGSYGDSLSDEDVLASLKAWNSANRRRAKGSGSRNCT